MIFEVLIMLCNTDILINVTPIFLQAFADSLSLIRFVSIALHLLHYNDQTMLFSSNKHDVRFIQCAYEQTKAISDDMKEAILGLVRYLSYNLTTNEMTNQNWKAGKECSVLKGILFSNQMTIHDKIRSDCVVVSIKADKDAARMLNLKWQLVSQ